jgi:uncharacterized protein YcaQ
VSAREITSRWSLPGMKAPIGAMAAEGILREVRVVDGDVAWPGRWYVLADDAEQLTRPVDAADARTTLLSPFDNLIADRTRTERLFGFRYRAEIYVPKAKRQFGYFVMPILHGDRLIGRVDPKVDRAAGRLDVQSVHVERGVDPGATHALLEPVLDSLAAFLGVGGWKRSTRTAASVTLSS